MIRRRFAPLLALAVMGALLVGASPVGAGQVALGISKSNGGETMAAFDAFTVKNGGVAPNLWTLRSKWGGSDKAFPTAAAAAVHARGAVPVIWWSPIDPAKWHRGKYEKLQRIIDGKHDTYIRQWALDAKSFGDMAIVRMAHEPNVSVFPWGKGWFNNSAKRFRKAWKHVVDIFREEDVDNIKFLWSVAKQSCKGCNPYKKWFPGNSYVDYAGLTGFNWGGYHGRKWVSMVKAYTQPMKKFKQFTSKPIIVAETASSHKNGNKAKWIKKGYVAVHERWPRIKGILYLDSDEPHNQIGHPRWRLAKPNNGSAQAAYAIISAKADFQGTLD